MISRRRVVTIASLGQPSLEGGFRPPLVDGFRRALAATEHALWTAAELADRLENETGDPCASHPTLRDRITALRSLADSNREASDDAAPDDGVVDDGAVDGKIDPFKVASSLLDGTLAAVEWQRMCGLWGIADDDFAAVVQAERDRLIEAGRLVRPEGPDVESS